MPRKTIQTKSVHSSIEPAKDGLRILAARLRGRGLPKDRYDVWMANLGPSETLLRAFQMGKLGWAEFQRRYKAELFEGGAIDARNRTKKNHGQKVPLRLLQMRAERQPVTLLCHCGEEEAHSHRHILKQVLEAKI